MEYLFGASGENAIGDRRLRVRIGPNTTALQVAHVNNEDDPVFVDSPFFAGNVLVRVRDFRGVVPRGRTSIASSPYFEGKKRLFSIQVQGRFKHNYPADDIYFGAEFDRKVNPPTGAWMAVKFANYIDPALRAELYSDRPWFWSPLLASMNIVHVQDLKNTPAVCPPPGAHPEAVLPGDNRPETATTAISEHGSADDSNVSQRVFGANLKASKPVSTQFYSSLLSNAEASHKPTPSLLLGNDWTFKHPNELTEDSTLLGKDLPFEHTDMTTRRRHFGDEDNRRSVMLTNDKLYNMEIFAPFINMNTFDLTLGININLLRYMNDQPIRMVAKSWASDQPLFVVEFDLVTKDKIDPKLEEFPAATTTEEESDV